ELAQRLAHQPGLDTDEGIAHLAFNFGPWDEGRDRVHDDAIDAARADQCLRDLQGLLAGIRLAYQELVHVDAAGAGIRRIQSVLDVDECNDAAAALCFRENVLAERGLARRFRAEDLRDPAARHATHA